MELKEIAAEYRRNAAALEKRAKELRKSVKTERMLSEEAYRRLRQAGRYEAIAGDNLRTAAYLEGYYDD